VADVVCRISYVRLSGLS